MIFDRQWEIVQKDAEAMQIIFLGPLMQRAFMHARNEVFFFLKQVKPIPLSKWYPYSFGSMSSCVPPKFADEVLALKEPHDFGFRPAVIGHQ